jgi:hypothetical protein
LTIFDFNFECQPGGSDSGIAKARTRPKFKADQGAPVS